MPTQRNFQHNHDTITFINNVRISKKQFDALHSIRGESMNTPSFIWQELSRLHESEEDELTVKLRVAGFKRIKQHLDVLVGSKFFKMEAEEITEGAARKMRVRLYEVHPGIQSIIPLM